jgi:acyl dehydratase
MSSRIEEAGASSTRPTITDAGVAALRERIGVPEPHPVPPHYSCPNDDAFRHVAAAYGDDNPLWSDAAYAARTRWKQPIAPPLLVGGDSLIGVDEVTEIAAAKQKLMRGDPLRGAHAFYSGSFREWWAPLYAGSRVKRRNALVAVLDKPSEFAKRAIHEWTAQVFQTDGGQLLSGQYKLMIRTEREKAQARGKYNDVKIEPYTLEQIAHIDADYERERRRGAEPRWFEDVNEGDEIGPLVKGPLTVTDMVCWHAGVGMGLYGVAALRLGFQNRRRIPRFYELDELGIPDAMQRCHWDPAYARKAGNPTTYDYGRMREAWLIHLCCDWMGDDAWLWKLDCQFNRFNFVGDTHWMRGRVARKYMSDGDRPAVDLELQGVNQRGEITTPGHAAILLPSREHGPVRLPDPPGHARDLKTVIEALGRSFAEL